MSRFLLAPALALALAACGPPPLTQDRLTPEVMEEMVAGPMRHAQAGDVPRAQREFEVLLARSDPEDRSDLLTAFGIGLYMLGPVEGDDPIYRRLSLPYLERAIPAARSRFGAWHPETALILATYGDALRQSAAGDPPRQADRVLAEAYLIRERMLGPGNVETVAALLELARVRGLPSRTGGDPGRIAEVERMYEDAIRRLEADRFPNLPTPEKVRFELLEMRVLNRQSRTGRAAPRSSPRT